MGSCVASLLHVAILEDFPLKQKRRKPFGLGRFFDLPGKDPNFD